MQWPYFIGAVLTVFTIAAGQIFFKLAAMKMNGASAAGIPFWKGFFSNYHLAIAFVIYMSASVMWVWILKHLPLSKAYPFMALSFVLIPIVSYLIFKEEITTQHIIGTALIVGGIIVVNI